MNYIVYYAHFTTESDELVEFSAIKIDSSYNIVDYYDITIKTLYPLDWRVKKITGLSDETINKACDLNEGIEKIIDWVAENNNIFITWTHSTWFALKNIFEQNNMGFVNENRWFSLSGFIAKKMDRNNQPSIKDALSHFGLEFVGTRGVAQYDCENVANIFMHLKPNLDEVLVEKRARKIKVSDKRRKLIKHLLLVSLINKVTITWEDLQNNSLIKDFILTYGNEEEERLKSFFLKVINSDWLEEKKNSLL